MDQVVMSMIEAKGMQGFSPSCFTEDTFPESVAPASVADGSGLAHDAGNLFGALQLYCDLLDAPGVLRSEHQHYVRELRLLSDRSSSLIRQLLAYGPQRPERRRPLQVAEVVQAFVPLLRSIAAPDASVSLAIGAEIGLLPFEAEVLERILVNLVRNAADALRANAAVVDYSGQIHIGLCASGGVLRLTVIDNGPGMPESAAEEFLATNPRRRRADGGLGHRVVQELVSRTGGCLGVSVTPGQGTLVEMEWPLRGNETPDVLRPH